MTRPIRFAATLLICALPFPAKAQSQTFEGYFEVGAREVSVSGDEAKYEQHINLDDGVRLHGLGLTFRSSEAQGVDDPVPDLVTVRATGFGGEPYENLHVDIREYGSYRFRYDRRQSDYFYEDLLVSPGDASIEGATGGDFHHFDFERTHDAVSLDLDITDRISVGFDYEQIEKDGDSTTVYDIEREEFELDRPIDESSQSIGANIAFNGEKLSAVWTERFREYDNASNVFLPGSSSGSEPTEPTELDFFFLDQPYDFDAREHQLELLGRPNARLELRLEALLTDLDMDLVARERSQGVDFTGTPFARDVSGGGDVDRETEHYELAASFAAHDRVRLVGSLRRETHDQTGLMVFGPSFGISDWDVDTNGVELGAEFLVADSLVVALGWATEKREVDAVQESEASIDTEDTETDRDGYFLDVAYNPDARLSLSLSVEDDSIEDPFSLATATDSRRYRLRGRYRWNDRTTVTASYRRTDVENDDSGWASDSAQANVRLTHRSERWNLSAGASWVDVERQIDQQVVGGFRQDVFDIDYDADTSVFDVAVGWTAFDKIDFGGSFLTYETDGRFAADRDDARLFAQIELPNRYRLHVGYRNVDFDEDDLEAFDADIWEIRLNHRW